MEKQHMKHVRGSGTVIVKQLLRIPLLGEWLTNWCVRREFKHLKNKYHPLIKEAERVGTVQEQAELAGKWAVERSSVLDPILVQNSDDLIAQALMYGIPVPPQEQDSEHYRRSGVTGELILRQPAQRKLRREVRNERRARNDEFRKWATVIFAVLAFALGLASLVEKTKQPDPCPRNYYRNDAGVCIFALAPDASKEHPIPRPVDTELNPKTGQEYTASATKWHRQQVELNKFSHQFLDIHS
jgi:hypothetical protein